MADLWGGADRKSGGGGAEPWNPAGRPIVAPSRPGCSAGPGGESRNGRKPRKRWGRWRPLEPRSGGAATEAGVAGWEAVVFWGVHAPSSRSGEMADAADSKSVASNGVWVQVPPPVLENKEQTTVGASFMTPGVVTGRSWRRGWLGRFLGRGFWCRLFLLSHAHVVLHGAAVVETPRAAVEHDVRR